MNAKILSFDIAKEKIKILERETETEILVQIENHTEDIIVELLNDINEFAKITMEKSSAQQQDFFNQWGENLNISGMKDISSENSIEAIEKLIFNITQEKRASEEDRTVVQNRIKEFLDVKQAIEASFKRIELEKITVDNEIAYAESSIAEFQKNVDIELANKDVIINDIKAKLDVSVKTVETNKDENRLLNSENSILKEGVKKLKHKNFEIEDQNRVFFAEIAIAKKELDFIEKKFLNEQTQLNDKINELQGKLDSALRESEILRKEKLNVEFQNIQSQKALEHSNLINTSLKKELQKRDEYLKHRETEIKNKDADIREKEIEIKKIQEKSYQNDAVQVSKIQILEDRLKQNDAHYSKKIEELGVKLSDSLNLANIMEVEKNRYLEALNKIKKDVFNLESQLKISRSECITLNTEIDELKLKLNESQKQKELLIANKLNNTLQIKRDNYIEKRPNKLTVLKFAYITVFLFIVIVTIGYNLFASYYYPMVENGKKLKNEIIGLNTQLGSKKKHIDSIIIEKTQLTYKLNALTQKLKILQENVTKAKIENHKLPIISNTPIVNNLIETVYFDSGNSNLSERDILKIKEVADKYNRNPYISIRLEGHTDDKMFRFPMFNQYNNNFDLSVARSAEVSRMLVQYGMDTSQISIVGLGDMYPLAPNDNSENREKNRRVEIKVTDSRKYGVDDKQVKIDR